MKFSQQRVLIILLVISIVVVLLNDIIFNETPELFSFGDELGAALSNLSLAYISSYIFYYVVVVIKERKDVNSVAFAALLKTYIDLGKLGEKSGEGFYKYPDPQFKGKEFV